MRDIQLLPVIVPSHHASWMFSTASFRSAPSIWSLSAESRRCSQMMCNRSGTLMCMLCWYLCANSISFYLQPKLSFFPGYFQIFPPSSLWRTWQLQRWARSTHVDKTVVFLKYTVFLAIFNAFTEVELCIASLHFSFTNTCCALVY